MQCFVSSRADIWSINMKPTAQLLLMISQNMHTSIEPRSDLDDVENQIAEVMDRLGNVVTRSELFEVMNGFGEPHMKRGYLVLNGNPFRADVVYDEIYRQAKKSIFILDYSRNSI